VLKFFITPHQAKSLQITLQLSATEPQ